MKILLVQPPHWSPDGHANFDAVEELLPSRAGDVVLLPELAGASDGGAGLRPHHHPGRAVAV
ncbi:hypothetical protein AB0J43_12700, partial [Nonomuraea fuscirosea]